MTGVGIALLKTLSDVGRIGRSWPLLVVRHKGHGLGVVGRETVRCGRKDAEVLTGRDILVLIFDVEAQVNLGDWGCHRWHDAFGTR